MKKILFAILIMICSGYVYAQQDSVFVDYSYDYYNKKVFHYSHSSEQCTYLICSAYKYGKVTSALSQKLEVSPCPYCIEGKEFKLKVGKTYIPIYQTKVTEFSLNTKDECSVEWTDAERGIDSESGVVWIGVAHERVTNAKIGEIKSAHTAVVLNAIAAGLSATAGVMSAARGNVLGSRISSINATTSAINAGFASAMSKVAEDLEIVVVVKNITDQEIQINNESRGRVWHLLPGESIEFGGINVFNERIRTEHKTNEISNVNYYIFNVKNHLLKATPIEQNGVWRSFRSKPLEEMANHYFNAEAYEKNGTLYEYNLETGAHRRVEQ